MFSIALGLLFFTLAGALALALIIAYHFIAYRVRGDKSLILVALFLAGGAVLLGGLLVSFTRVPWDDLVRVMQRR